MDHIKPRAAGGSNLLDNLQLVHCNRCGNDKGAWWDGVNYGPLRDPTYKVKNPQNTPRYRRKSHGQQLRGLGPVVQPPDDDTDWDDPVQPCA